MPSLDESGEALMRAERDARKRVSRAWDGFSDFALRDNVLEVAVGLMYVIPSACLLPEYLGGPHASTRSCPYWPLLTAI